MGAAKNAAPEALFLHCSLAHLGAWRGVAKALEGDLSMLMMDLPGHGQSADFDVADPDLDYQDLALSWALALLKAEVDGPVDLVGHSFGATIALRLAQAAPDRMRSLTLIEPVLFAAAQTHPLFAENTAYMEGPFADAMRAGDKGEAARLFNDLWGNGTAWEALPERVRKDMAARIDLIPVAKNVTHGDVHGQVAPGALEALDMPCLLIEGGNSPAIIAAIHDVFEARIPDVRRVVTQGAGHMAPITHPVQVARALHDFLTAAPRLPPR